MNTFIDDDEKEQPVPGICLQPPYSNELYEFCKKLDREIGTKNGPTALYWHVQDIFMDHIKD